MSIVYHRLAQSPTAYFCTVNVEPVSVDHQCPTNLGHFLWFLYFKVFKFTTYFISAYTVACPLSGKVLLAVRIPHHLGLRLTVDKNILGSLTLRILSQRCPEHTEELF